LSLLSHLTPLHLVVVFTLACFEFFSPISIVFFLISRTGLVLDFFFKI
jgi:hypothetical protein